MTRHDITCPLIFRPLRQHSFASTSTRSRMRINAPRDQGTPSWRTPSSSLQQNPCFLRSIFPKRKKDMRNFPRTRKFGWSGKICRRQHTRRQKSRSKTLETKTNLAPLMMHLGRRQNQIKKMVQLVWLLTSTNILTPSLRLLLRRRLCWKNW